MNARQTAQVEVSTMVRRGQLDTLDAIFEAVSDATNAGDFWLAYELDNRAEDKGAHSDDRETCHTCKTWATPEHVESRRHNSAVFGS